MNRALAASICILTVSSLCPTLIAQTEPERASEQEATQDQSSNEPQQTPPSEPSPAIDSATSESVQRLQTRISDQAMASLLKVGAEHCLEMSRFAESKTTSADVKAFIQKQRVASEEMIAKLAEFGAWEPAPIGPANNATETKVVSELDTDRDASREPPPARISQSRGKKVVVSDNAENREGFSITNSRGIGAECLKLTREYLQEKSGADFDSAYMTTEMMALTQSLAMMQVAERYAGSDLREALAYKIKSTKTMLREAEEIVLAGRGTHRNSLPPPQNR